jgi:hypothetical protein
VAFTEDANTMALNHFEGSTITLSDDTVVGVALTYTRGGVLYKNDLLYVYALDHATSPGYIASNRTSVAALVDLPAGYSTANARQLPFYIPIQSTAVPYSVFQTNPWHRHILPSITAVSAATNTTVTTYSLAAWVPADCCKVDLLVTHTHVGTTSCGIVIGPDNAATLYQTILTTATAGTTQMQITMPLIALGLDAYLSAAASTTSYTIAVTGYYTTCSV